MSKNEIAFSDEASELRFELEDSYAESRDSSSSIAPGVASLRCSDLVGDSAAPALVCALSNCGEKGRGPGVDAKCERFPWPKLKL